MTSVIFLFHLKSSPQRVKARKVFKMASVNKEQIGSDSKRARMSSESEACLKEDSENSEIALKHLDAVEDLSREDIEEIDKNRTLIQAVKSKNLKMVKKLLDLGANIDVQDEKGATPLFYACRNGHDKIAARLMNRGANVNMKTVKGEAILGVAIEKNKVEMTQKLLKFGANPNDYHVRDTLFRTKGNVEIVKSLLQYGFKVTQIPLLWPIICNNSEVLQIMLDHGAELKDLKSINCIVSRGQLKVLKVLLKHGVDLNRYTTMISLPLHYAIGKNHIEIVAELLKNGANPNLPNHYGITPIQFATKFPCDLVVFLNSGVSLDLNKRNNDGETVLEIALRRGWKDASKMLFHHNHNKL